jgi:threonine/homoserine/homoserine lactone efflux protein
MYIETLAVFALVHLLAAASPGPNLVVVSSYGSTV